MENVVGLFGTCGKSTWREDIAIPQLEAAGIEFFNPVVEDWTPECMANEAKHAAKDRVILQPITGETTGIGSLAESGWIALQAYLRGQKLVLFLGDMPEDSCPNLDENGGAFRPNKTRNLVRNHIAALPTMLLETTVFLCGSLEEAVSTAIELMQD